MAQVILQATGINEGTGVIIDALTATALSGFYEVESSTTAISTFTPDDFHPAKHLDVTFTGIGLDKSGGTVNQLDFSRNGGESEFTVTGLSIDADQLEDAINEGDFGDSLQTLINGTSLQADLSAGQVGLEFQGLGGNDTVTLTSFNDTYHIDGGNDTVDLGAGDDTVIAFAFPSFGAAGTVSINGNTGTDILDLNPEGNGTQSVKHAVTVDLQAKIIDLGEDWQLALTGFEQSIFAAFPRRSGCISDDIGMKFRNRHLEAIAAPSVRA